MTLLSEMTDQLLLKEFKESLGIQPTIDELFHEQLIKDINDQYDQDFLRTIDRIVGSQKANEYSSGFKHNLH